MAGNPEVTGKPYTSPQVNPYGRVDEEVASVGEREAKRRKRTKCAAYVGAFIVFQTAIILIFGLTVMRVRTPRFRVRSARVDSLDVATLDSNPSFSVRMSAELGVKNANFGHYKYRNSTVEFFYKGAYKVGEAVVPSRRAKARSTRKFDVVVELSSATVPPAELAGDLRARPVISLTSRSTLRGKVEIMKIVKKNKSSNMNCTMEINTSSREIGNIFCR